MRRMLGGTNAQWIEKLRAARDAARRHYEVNPSEGLWQAIAECDDEIAKWEERAADEPEPGPPPKPEWWDRYLELRREREEQEGLA